MFRRHGKNSYSEKIKLLTKQPCFLCGWDKSYCDRHRLVRGADGGKYEVSNLVALCPNCHRIEHHKKIKNKYDSI